MRGHGAGSDAPYVSVVAPAGHEEDRAGGVLVEHLHITAGLDR